MKTINAKDTGYRGVWYMNQPSEDEFAYKYSGGLGTYCAKHMPFAVYRPEVNKTFFCYGGSGVDRWRDYPSPVPAEAIEGPGPGRLLHKVSCYDHDTGLVPRPTVLLDKDTGDAHDNPVISVDAQGHIWIFSTSHGTTRPSFFHRSRRPYDIDEFEHVPATRLVAGIEKPFDNFSYMQAWHVPEHGFRCFMSRYQDPAVRTIGFITSPDGVSWSEWTRLAAIEEGHYQLSAVTADQAGTAFNYHPAGKSVNHRTNLYFMQSTDDGHTWQSADGTALAPPLTRVHNAALIHDYAADGLLVYLKDIGYDDQGHPVVLYLTSPDYRSGPHAVPRTWTTARWDGERWIIRPAMTSDSNYDMGSLYLEKNGLWRIIAPTETGPQPFNPGGEVALWLSPDQGLTWEKARQVTSNSPRNHTYVRRPVNAHPDFYAFWADGHAREPSESWLHFSDRDGRARRLPPVMNEAWREPKPVSP